MRIVTTDVDTKFRGVVAIPAGTSVVISDGTAARMVTDIAKLDPQARVRISSVGQYARPFCGQDLNGKSLLVWRGHGIGDQIICMGVVRHIRERWPRAEIDYYTHPGVMDFWRDPGVELPCRVLSMPIHVDDWHSYHYHLCYEGMCENDHEPNQPNIFDASLARAGIPVDSVPPRERLPIVPINGEDRDEARAILAGIPPGAPVAVVQVGSTSTIRSMRPDRMRDVMLRLARAMRKRGGWVVVAATPRQIDEYELEDIGVWPDNTLFPQTRLRVFFAILERAAVCVCPDSVFGHACGAIGTPCVSFWGAFAPATRIGNYAHHYPLVRHGSCGPCFAHDSYPTMMGCPLAVEDGGSPYCREIATIPPRLIVQRALEVAMWHRAPAQATETQEKNDGSTLRR